MAKILRKSQENHKAQVQENAKKIKVHLLYMSKYIKIYQSHSSFLQKLRKSQPQIHDKLRKLSLRKKVFFL